MTKRWCVMVAAWLLAVLVSDADAGLLKKKKSDKADEFVSVMYPVADLVVPVDDWSESGRVKQHTLEDRLIEVIRRSVAPSTWIENGGLGSVQYFPLGMGLVVRQTRAVQEEVFALLKDLRRLQDVEVVVEIEVVAVSEDGLNSLSEEQRPDKKKSQTLLMESDELHKFLHTLQGDQATSIMQAPKVTMFNAQRAKVSVTDTHICVTDVEMVREAKRVVIRPKKETVVAGLDCIVRPVASVDRDAVRLSLDARIVRVERLNPIVPVMYITHTEDGRHLAAPVTEVCHKVHRAAVARILKIPTGHTAVLYVGQLPRHAGDDQGEASLVSSLGRCLDRAEHECTNGHFFLLATTRVIVNTEAEAPAPEAAHPPVPRF